MKNKADRPEKTIEPCRRPQGTAQGKTILSQESLKTMSIESIQQIFSELQIHKTELEMQNEELKRTQDELEVSRDRYADFYDRSPVGHFTLSQKGLILQANLTAASLLGVSRKSLIRQPLTRFILSEDQDIFYLNQKRLIKSGDPQVCDLRMVKRGGTVFWTHLATCCAQNPSGSPEYSIVASDITESRIADDTIKTALHEKDLLLREIHHRVKNNMQVISSLLYLQAERMENEQARQALFESQQRILAMAMIHEVLYSGQHLASIDLSDYLKCLINHLQDVFSTRANVHILIELEKVELDINQAVPCSLILNELITNAFKHAFPGGNSGIIRIKLKLVNDKEVLLEISDNGIGFSAGPDIGNPGTLGLMLVQRLLKKQLNGSLDMATKDGTTFILRWPLSDVPLRQTA